MTILSQVCGTSTGCDRWPHRPDRTDPNISWCVGCKGLVGNPGGAAHTTAGIDLEEPFGEPAEQ